MAWLGEILLALGGFALVVVTAAFAIRYEERHRPAPQPECVIQRVDWFRALDPETMGPIDLYVVTDKRRPCVVA